MTDWEVRASTNHTNSLASHIIGGDETEYGSRLKEVRSGSKAGICKR